MTAGADNVTIFGDHKVLIITPAGAGLAVDVPLALSAAHATRAAPLRAR
ncbi:MAG: hypothetical protein LAP87_15510 [Acidobacteriia bacterium]|nr:hypothetical protein [Terriglobia bacterium]